MPRVVYHNNRVASIHGLQRVAICPRLRVFLMIELYRITRTVLDKRIPLVNRTNINRQVIDTVVMVMRLEWLDIRALHFDVLTVNLAQTVTPRIWQLRMAQGDGVMIIIRVMYRKRHDIHTVATER